MLPKLTPRSAELFKRFIDEANMTSLHEWDWRRFYAFVRGTRPSKLSSHELVLLLEREGFSKEYARHIALIYEHLRDYDRPLNIAEIAQDHFTRVQKQRRAKS
jgi:hypothetical protein